MKLSVLSASVLVLVWASPALSGFDIEQVTTHTADCSSVDVASSDNGLTMLAYVARGDPVLMSFVTTQLVPTNPAPGEVWPAPVTINSGGIPRICWSYKGGFVLALASGGMVLVYEADQEGNWDLQNYYLLPSGGEVMGMDLWGVPSDAAGPYAFLTVQVSFNPPNNDHRVLYAHGTVSGWTDLEEVAAEATLFPRPQMTWDIGPAGPWASIYYLSSAFGGMDLVHTTRDPVAGWSAPVVVPGDGATGTAPIEGDFDVVTSWGVSRNVLGRGPQPTCPCGSLIYLGNEFGSGWDPQVELTVNHMDFDWPWSPQLGASLIDPMGWVHAFWMQIGSGPDLEPKTKTLEYWVKTGAGWVDAGGFLDGQDGGPLGEYVSLDVSPDGNVVMAWTRRDTIGGVPQPKQVWMARPHQPSDVPGPQVSNGTVTLSAWPNPFNPRVRLAMTAEVSGRVTLDVYDVSGRRVTRLFEGELPAGRREAEWDGRDAAGRSVPSGVYFARLESAAGCVVTKLVLAE